MTFYLEDTPILVRDLEESVKHGNGSKLHMSAHRLRGLSAGFDAHALVDAAAQLEEMGRAGFLEGASVSLTELRQSWEETCAALKEYVR